jgi:hypothetical protein
MNETTGLTLSTSSRFRRALGWIAVGMIAWNVLIAPVAIFAIEATGREAPAFEPLNLGDLLAIVTTSSE